VKTESKAKVEAEEVAAHQRAERQRKAAQMREMKARREAEIDAGATLPASLPGDIAAACDAFVAAYDAYMKQGTDAEIQEFHDGRRAELGEHRARCITLGSIEVAACGVEVLRGDYPSLADLPRARASKLLLEACAKKYGPA
jgi:hypothetical protein